MSVFRLLKLGFLGAGRIAGGIIDTTSKYLLDLFANDFEVANEVSTFNQTIGHSASTNATMTSGYGAELVTNGDFSNGTTGWAATSSAAISEALGQLSITGVLNHGAYQVYALPVGTYEFSFNLVSTGGIGAKLIGKTAADGISGGTTFDTGYQTSVGVHKFVLDVTLGTASIVLRLNGTGTVVVDNISVREMPAIKWRPHNGLRYSEDFTQVWTNNLMYVTANAAVAPDGQQTADKIAARSIPSPYSMGQAWNYGRGLVTVAVYAKAAEQNYAVLAGYYPNNGGGAIWALVDLTDGSVPQQSSLYLERLSVTSVGSGWYRIEVEIDASFIAQIELRVAGAPASTTSVVTSGSNAGRPQYTGDDTSGIYVWGAHSYISSLGGMVDNPDRGDSYVPTTSSAVYLPRRGHHIYNGYEWVNEGMLHESEGRTNLEPYSKIDSGWNAAGLTSLTADVAISPTGVQDATEIIENATGGSHYVYRDSSFTTSNVDNTFSAYVKRGSGSRHIQLRAFYLGSAAPYVNFDLENGVVGTTSGASGTTSSGHTWTLSNTNMDDVGNGWYRISATVNASTGFGFGLYLTDSTTAAESYAYTGDGTSSLYIWNAQTEEASTPSSPIPTFGATVTRAAESLTIPAANLPWPTPNVIGSELVTNGGFDTASDWTLGTGWTISGGQLSHAAGTASNATQNITLTTGKVYRATCDVIACSGGSGALQFRLGGTTTGVTITGSDVGQSVEVIYVADGNTQIAPYAGSGTTLIVDNISVKEIDPLSVSIQMNGRMTYADTNSAANGTFVAWPDIVSPNYIWLFFDSDRGSGGVTFRQRANGTLTILESTGSVYSPGVFVPFNIASRHGSTFINAAVDGVALTANTTPTALPDLSTTDLNLGYDFMGTIQNFQIWDRDIGDQGLVDETAPSLEPSLFLTFDGTTGSYTVRDWSE